jgi:transcriptional regulator with XRE-family HTH domain
MLEKNVKAIDKIIGNNIRINRIERGLTQGKLAQSIGVTFQQVQKYEKGTNRVGGSRLVQIAEALNVSIAAFFENAVMSDQGGQSELSALCIDRNAVRLLRAFSRIKHNLSQRALVTLAEEIADKR